MNLNSHKVEGLNLAAKRNPVGKKKKRVPLMMRKNMKTRKEVNQNDSHQVFKAKSSANQKPSTRNTKKRKPIKIRWRHFFINLVLCFHL
jgi:hypothetical protein